LAAAEDMTPVAYTINPNDNTVRVIDLNKNTVFATVYDVLSPAELAVTPDGAWLFATDNMNDTVSIVNMTSYIVMGTIPVGKAPAGIAMAPDGKTAYVANEEDNTISIINITARKVKGTISAGKGPYGVAVNPVNGDVYVANVDDGTVSVIRADNVVATIPSGKNFAGALAVTPDGNRLLTLDTENQSVKTINTTTFKIVDTVKAGLAPGWIEISPDGWYAYIENRDSENISILQLSDNTIRVSFSARNITSMALKPDGKAIYYTTNPDTGINVMDSGTGVVKARIDINAMPVKTAMISSSRLVDTVPPVTTLNLVGINDSNGYFISQVTCNLTAVDYPSGTAIKNIQYSMDGITWAPYGGNFTLKDPRLISVYYRASDDAGNVEIVKASRIIIVAAATAKPTVGPSLPPKPTALPPEEIFTATPPVVSEKPKPTGGSEILIAIIGMLCTGSMIEKNKRH
jgi:YVTN family beta-propeller protein